MQNKIFKEEFSVVLKPEVSLEKRIKRSEINWNFIRWAFTISSGIIIGLLPIEWFYKIFVLIILFWIFFFNTRFQNLIIKLKAKIEDWRRI